MNNANERKENRDKLKHLGKLRLLSLFTLMKPLFINCWVLVCTESKEIPDIWAAINELRAVKPVV